MFSENSYILRFITYLSLISVECEYAALKESEFLVICNKPKALLVIFCIM